MAFYMYAMAKRAYSAHTARTQRCWRLLSAHLGDLQFLGRCGNVNGRDSGVTGVLCFMLTQS